jgi:hypothetical protein
MASSLASMTGLSPLSARLGLPPLGPNPFINHSKVCSSCALRIPRPPSLITAVRAGVGDGSGASRVFLLEKLGTLFRTRPATCGVHVPHVPGEASLAPVPLCPPYRTCVCCV